MIKIPKRKIYNSDWEYSVDSARFAFQSWPCYLLAVFKLLNLSKLQLPFLNYGDKVNLSTYLIESEQLDEVVSA